MEALFIGLLCVFERNLDSPFRYYYLLSLFCCALRHSRAPVTVATFLLHSLSVLDRVSRRSAQGGRSVRFADDGRHPRLGDVGVEFARTAS